MISDHRGHATRQTFRAVEAIEQVPDLARETAFLDGTMANARRKAREIKGLKPSAAEAQRHGLDVNDLMKRLTAHNQKVDKMGESLQHLHESRGEDAPRALPVQPFKSTDKISSQTRP